MPTVLTAYAGPRRTRDGLALGRLLAAADRADVALARLVGGISPRMDRASQLAVRDLVAATRDMVNGNGPVEILPLVDARPARALRHAVEDERARYLVLAGRAPGRLAALLLGSPAARLVDDAPCPLAFAPRGFASRPSLRPGLIGVGYDGSPGARAALALGIGLAQRTGAHLVVLGAATARRPAVLTGAPRGLPRLVLDGEAGPVLAGATRGLVGLLLVGAPTRGPLARSLMGGVVDHVLSHAACPVVVCPPAAGAAVLEAPRGLCVERPRPRSCAGRSRGGAVSPTPLEWPHGRPPVQPRTAYRFARVA